MAQAYYAAITIDHTKVPNTDQSNFAVLVAGTYAGAAGVPDLRTNGNGGHVHNANGYDVAFYSDSGLTTLLKWETEKYVAATGEVVYWVKIPTLSHTSDTVIYIAYGDTGISTDQSDKVNVWDSHFKAVYHMGDGSTISVADATGGNNGTNNGATASTGKISGAAHFVQASSQNVDLGTGLNIPGDVTVSAWVHAPTESGYRVITARAPNGSAGSFSFYLNSNEIRWYDGVEHSSGNNIANNSWQLLTARRSGTTLTMYINGVITSSGPITVASPNSDASKAVKLGSNYDNTLYFDGDIDELRISDSARAVDWMLTEYNNQNDPSSFYTMGTEQTNGSTVDENFTLTGTGSIAFSPGIPRTDSITLTGTGAYTPAATVNLRDAVTLSATAAASIGGGQLQPDGIELDLTAALSLAYQLDAGVSISPSATPAVSYATNISGFNSLSIAATPTAAFSGVRGLEDSITLTLTGALALANVINAAGAIALSATSGISVLYRLAAVGAVTIAGTPAVVLANFLKARNTVTFAPTAGFTPSAGISVADQLAVSAGAAIALLSNQAAHDALVFAVTPADTFAPDAGSGRSITLSATAGISVTAGSPDVDPGGIRPADISGNPSLFKDPGESTATPGNLRPSGISGRPTLFRPKQ